MMSDISLNANEFRNLSRSIPENLEKFSKVYFGQKYLGLVKGIGIISISAIKGFIFTLFNSRIVFVGAKNKHYKESIFLSHYFDGSPVFDNDAFFGKMPSHVSEYYETSLLYLSQDSKHSSSNFFKSKSAMQLQHLSLPLAERLLIFLKNLNFAVSLLVYPSRYLQVTDRHNRISIAVEQSNVRTLRNLLSIETVLSQVCPVRTKYLWFTFEGHPYERLLVSKVRSKFPNVKLLAYQHAPIVPAQIGLFAMIRDFGESFQVCTSGLITRDYLRGIFPRMDQSIFEIGSSKGINKMNLGMSDRHSFLSLFLPEGTCSAALSMFRFAVEVESIMPNVEIRFRPHPRTPKCALARIHQMVLGTRINLSEKSLYEDLEESSIFVYRSSSTAIEGLLFGNLPVFLNLGSDESLDTLSISNLSYPKVADAQNFCKLIKDLSTKSNSPSFSSQETFSNFALNYFTPLSIPWSQIEA
jgi:hypothetical protein